MRTCVYGRYAPTESNHLTLMMTSDQVVETLVNVTGNTTTRSTVTPGFKPFTVFHIISTHSC